MGRAGIALAALTALALAAGCGAPAARGPELRVSAATSLRVPLEAIAADFERERGVRVVLDFGASGVLAKRIESGAPADVFASADEKPVEALIEGGHISAEDTAAFASNELAVIVSEGDPRRVAGAADLANAGRLVTGDPRTASHGRLAREWLEGRGLWSRLEPRFVFADNAAQTADLVARGEADAGIVFASEARSREGIEVAYVVPAGEHPRIEYVAAVVSGSPKADLAAEFVALMLSDSGQGHLATAGFLP